MPKLYLSEKVSVSPRHVTDLKSYHVWAVRSLYESYYGKFKGKLITYPDGVNVSVILRAFLSAILEEIRLPVLVVCESENVPAWHYELSKLTAAKVLSFESPTANFNIDISSVVICSNDNLKDFQNVAADEWSIVVAENIESLVNKLPFKRIGDAQFKVALSKTDFMHAGDLKVFWHVLNWCNPGKFGKLIEFAEVHKRHYDNLRDPYDDVWYRVDWDLPENYLIDWQGENKEYNKLVREWGENNNINIKSSTSMTTRRSGGGKRKLDKNDSGTKTKMISFENNTSTKRLNNNINNSTKRKANTFIYTQEKDTRLKRIKSADDIESAMLEDSWIEDFMMDMEIPETPSIPDALITQSLGKEQCGSLQFGGDIEKRTPKSSQRTAETDEHVEEYPIIEAIIKGGASLKSAVEKQMFNMLGVMDIADDMKAFSQKSRKSQELFVACEDVSSPKSTENANVLTFLFGDKAAIINEHKCIIFDDSF